MKNMLLTLVNPKPQLILGSAMAALSLLVSPVLQAQITENWNDGNDTSPLLWQHANNGGTPTSYTYPANPWNGTLAYQVSGGSAGAVFSMLGGPSSGGAVPDFTMSVDVINWDTSALIGETFGLYGRFNLGTGSGYGLQIRKPTGSTGQRIRIDKFTFGSVSTLVSADFVAPIDPSTTGGYRLVFSAYGSTLTGQIFDNSTGLVVPLVGGGSSISFTDTSYTAGQYGVGVVYINNNPITATYDNFTMVPEPSAAALAGMGIAMLLMVRRRF